MRGQLLEFVFTLKNGTSTLFSVVRAVWLESQERLQPRRLPGISSLRTKPKQRTAVRRLPETQSCYTRALAWVPGPRSAAVKGPPRYRTGTLTG